MKSLMESLEATPRAIILYSNGKWGVTDVEGSEYSAVCRHDHIENAVADFTGAAVEATADERILATEVAIRSSFNSKPFAAEWWNGRWHRPWSVA